VQAYLHRLGLDPNAYVIDDGCGLSHENRLSARCLTSVLTDMWDGAARELFRDSLATPEKGTLEKSVRFGDKSYVGRLYAKTGYIAGVRALSGYCQRADGGWLAFSILADNANGDSRVVIDDVVAEMMKTESPQESVEDKG
jgi:D-alanyl-D-alanine carboxypeptidase/D-alanyl-D-alanine-endopeptidase (penicillin-binding protein 4)